MLPVVEPQGFPSCFPWGWVGVSRGRAPTPPHGVGHLVEGSLRHRPPPSGPTPIGPGAGWDISLGVWLLFPLRPSPHRFSSAGAGMGHPSIQRRDRREKTDEYDEHR